MCSPLLMLRLRFLKKNFFFNFILLFLAVWVFVAFFVWAFSGCDEQGLLFVVVHRG